MSTRIGFGSRRPGGARPGRSSRLGVLVASVGVWMGCARGIDPGTDTGGGPIDGGDAGGTDAVSEAPPACSGSCSLPHSTAMCVSGTCSVSHCDPGYADLNHMASDGCECQVGMLSSACTTATDQGTVDVGSMHMVTGVIPGPGMDQWFRVTFAASGHQHITFMTNPGMSLHFDVATACSMGSTLMCMDRTAGPTGLVDWEFFDAPSDAGVPDGGGDGGAGDASTRMVPFPTTVYVRIYTGVMPTGCMPYTLVISN